MLHLIPTTDGIYYYFCRPLIEIVGGLAWLAERMREFLDRLGRMLRDLGAQIPVLARAALQLVVDGLTAAAGAVAAWVAANWKELLIVLGIVVAIVLIVVFWEVIAGLLAGAAAGASALMGGLAAVLGAAALFLLVSPSPAPTDPATGGSSPAAAVTGAAQGPPTDLGALAASTARHLQANAQLGPAVPAAAAVAGRQRTAALIDEASGVFSSIRGAPAFDPIMTALRRLV